MLDSLVPLFFFLTASPAAEYERYDLFELAVLAERVVAGSITAVGSESFDLSVERELIGGTRATSLRLRRFQDWTCARRWAEYRIGQRVVLFLQGDRAMGAGDEGDWPIIEGQVLAPYRIHGLERIEHTVDGRQVGGSPLTLEELASSLTSYRRTFRARAEHGPEGDRLRMEFALDESAAQEFAGSSPIALQLYEETLSSPGFLELTPRPIPPALEVEPVIRARGYGILGDEIASPGDVNGDGWDDLAALDDQRVLRIALLDSTGHALAQKEITPDVLGIPDLWFAEGLAALGDFDHDGVPDLAVGSPARQKEEPGRVGLLCLNRDGSVKRTLVLDGTGLVSCGADQPGFGAKLTTIGDLDHNGTVDLLVQVDRDTFDGLNLARKEPAPRWLPVLFLDPSGVVLRTNPLTSRDFLEQPNPVTFAVALAEIGDLDGDGRSEVAIGYPYDGDGGDYRGAVWIASLDRDGALRTKTKISDWSEAFEAVLFDGDEFGRTLAAPGDLDGDGVPDLVVGGAHELWVLSLQRDGTVQRFSSFGARAGGFVPADRIRSLAVLRGPENSRRLVVVGTLRDHRERAIWVLKLGPDGVLSAP